MNCTLYSGQLKPIPSTPAPGNGRQGIEGRNRLGNLRGSARRPRVLRPTLGRRDPGRHQTAVGYLGPAHGPRLPLGGAGRGGRCWHGGAGPGGTGNCARRIGGPDNDMDSDGEAKSLPLACRR